MHTEKDPCHSQHGRKGGSRASACQTLRHESHPCALERPFLYQDFKVDPRRFGVRGRMWDHRRFDRSTRRKEPTMSKRARKRRSRKGNAANHGRKPNA